MGGRRGWSGGPAAQSRVSLSEAKLEADFCLLECVRSLLVGVFLRIRSSSLSLAVRSRAILCARFAGAASFAFVLLRMHGEKNFCARLRENCADVFAISTDGAGEGSGQDQVAGADGLPGKARGVHSRVHANAEETELRAAQGGARALDELGRGDHVYSRHRAQLAGALHRAGARGPREGSAGRAVSHRARDAGCGGAGENQAGAPEGRRRKDKGDAGSRRKQDVKKRKKEKAEQRIK